MSWNTLVSAVDIWAEERGIYKASNPKSQLLKAVSELGELCDAEIADDMDGQQDAVGDVLVCLIIYCSMKSYSMHHCLDMAYEAIKYRKGHMSEGGAFVKEE